ncbi:MAG: hypothetical protein OXC84_10085 [Gammaproteobacteria bacterium]|nr:hypothetical protein [Gammaproteobacteria bacterium]
MYENFCPLWGTPVSYFAIHPTRDGVNSNSPRTGGKYFTSGTAEVVLKSKDDNIRARLTSWLIEQRQLGDECPEIHSRIITQCEQRRSLSIHQRANNLLRYIQKQLPDIGSDFFFETQSIVITALELNPEMSRYMEMLAWSESTNMEELKYLLGYLESSGWLKPLRGGATLLRYQLTVSGYSYLTEIDHADMDSSQAFVAMWFDESMNEVWEEGLLPGIRDSGYEAVRIDKKEHLNKIDDEIIAEIRRSRFLVADFTQGETGPRGGVYYEAGFAHGLNIPVIFTCRKDALEKIHFDTRQYPHIVWETHQELRNNLAKRISAVLGDGPLKN